MFLGSGLGHETNFVALSPFMINQGEAEMGRNAKTIGLNTLIKKA
jgi:hypothetical protein